MSIQHAAEELFPLLAHPFEQVENSSKAPKKRGIIDSLARSRSTARECGEDLRFSKDDKLS